MNNIYDIKIVDGAETVTLTTAKEWLRVTSDDENDLITDLITIARKRVETYSSRSVISKRVTLTAFLDTTIPLPYAPILNIVSVKFLQGQIINTGANDWDTLDADEYMTIGFNDKHFKPYKAGIYEIVYNTNDNDDLGLKMDLKRVLLWMYENRGDDTDAIPLELFSNAKTSKVLSWV